MFSSGAPRELPMKDRNRLLVLDGGLATRLEFRGADLSDALWSARLLRDEPETIVAAHLDYLLAGADVLITASYQASVEGFRAAGATTREAESWTCRATELARAASHRASVNLPPGRRRPLVAASLGPWGACRADGSEYRGDYGQTEEELVEFHRPRHRLLAETGPDLFACETIPSAVEALALRRLLAEEPGPPAWLSFQCRDDHHLADGSAIAEVVASLRGLDRLVAVGVNCVQPGLVEPLIRAIRTAWTGTVVVYPNSGEKWDPTSRSWRATAGGPDLAALASTWVRAGASWIGGCCRTTPEDTRLLRELVDERTVSGAAPRTSKRGPT